MRLVLYSKPGCHLCEGLHEKLLQVRLPLELEVRDITTRDDWFQAYQFDIPVLYLQHATAAVDSPRLIPLPRMSPRASVPQIEQVLQKYLLANSENKAE